MTKKDIGFSKDNLIVIRRVDAFWKQMESFRTQLLEIPGIEKTGFSRAVPGTEFNNNAFFNDDDPEKNTYLINQTSVSFDFPEALGVQLTEGRFFSREYGSDSTSVLINEAAVRSLGLLRSFHTDRTWITIKRGYVPYHYFLHTGLSCCIFRIEILA